MNQLMMKSAEGIAPKDRVARFEPVSRRVGHGSMAWSSRNNLKQPQDGAVDQAEMQSHVTDIGTRLQMVAFGPALLMEPEDARITGGTRSLVRRLLGLNIMPRVNAAVRAAKPSRRVAAAAKSVQVA